MRGRNRMKILVIAAHPDDEVLGMGGTICKYTKNGHKVKIVIMATGIFARRSSDFVNNQKYEISKQTENEMSKQVVELRKDAKKSAKIMGVSDIEFFDFPDNEMDTVPILQVIKTLENIIAEFKPDTVYTHSRYDVNIDHRILYDATLVATRPISGTTVKKVISFEVPSSTEWYFPSQFSPNVFEDISNELTKKKNALKSYKTEIRKYPHPRSDDALDVIAKKWGTVCGCKSAEAFYLVRELNF